MQTCFMTDKGLRARLILPGASPYEKTGTVRNEDGIEQEVNAALEPPGQARRDWDILCDLAEAMALTLDEGAECEAVHRRRASWDYTRGAFQE
ncbi:MAG: molybdopterin-dependent oxidoreductase [Anaerolineaceae bacterium]|nr:molybdopterin-dependent oxidoreductase [Anaerolineaceae bacterium]